MSVYQISLAGKNRPVRNENDFLYRLNFRPQAGSGFFRKETKIELETFSSFFEWGVAFDDSKTNKDFYLVKKITFLHINRFYYFKISFG